MLTYDQIITLSDKGFSPEQIVKLTGEDIPEPVPKAAQPSPDQRTDPLRDSGGGNVMLTEDEKPEQNSESPAQILPGHEEKPEQNSDSGSLSSVLQEAIKGFAAEVAEMKKALQASNIRTIIREDIPPSKTADDVLAELIHPTIKKEEK